MRELMKAWSDSFKNDGTTAVGSILAQSNQLILRDATNANVLTVQAGNVGIGHNEVRSSRCM